MKSLAEYLSLNRLNTSLKHKLGILIDISRVMAFLFKLSEKNSHGHLCPENILIEPKSRRIKIVDFGFSFLRSYCSLLNGYRNKDVYCAPELMSKKGTCVQNHNESSDVYSYGMLAWFLFSGEAPFQGQPFSEVVRMILQQKRRPKIDEDLSPNLAKLIRDCWQDDPQSRPTFSEISDTLTGITFDLKN